MSSIHAGGVGTPGVPGPEAEIRRLKRRVLELEETNRALHERNQAEENRARTAEQGMRAANEEHPLRIQITSLQKELAKTRQERDEFRSTLNFEGEKHMAAETEWEGVQTSLNADIAKLTRELVEARATAATETKRADHHATEHAAAVKAQKGGRR